MSKSCLNCKRLNGCNINKAVVSLDTVNETFWCCYFKEKKKTITLYRYTYEDDGEIWISNWTSKQRGLPRGCSVLKTETKEVEL